MSQKVLIIGAGPCGLVALKECLEVGHDATCVEKANVVGGVFSVAPEACYDGLNLTTSNVFMAFGDYPPKDDWIRYSTKEEYAAYLVDYAAHFQLNKHIEFETEVKSASWGEGWTVTTACKGVEKTVTYDKIVVCTGANQEAKTMEFSGYEGRVLHSSDYQSPDEFEGKKVLVVGIGESSADICTEISEIAEYTACWSRRSVMYAPRFPDANLTDADHVEADVLKTPELARKMKVSDFLEFLTTQRIMTGIAIWQYGLMRQIMWRIMSKFASVQINELCKRCLDCTNGKGLRVFFQSDQAAWVTKNGRMCRQVAIGKVDYVVSPSITKIEGKRIEFEGGDSCEVDTIVCCTGYKQNFDWLKADVGHRCVRSFYKHCFPAGWGDKIAFVGYCRGHQGGIPQMGEMAARYVALVFKGERALPLDYAQRAKTEAKIEDEYYVLSPAQKALCDYPSYMDSMAHLIGCKPVVPWFKPARLFKYFFYPLWPCWYRERGPGANKEALDSVLDKFPIAKSIAPTPPIFLTVLQYFFQRLVTILLFPFMPKSGMDRFGFWIWVRPKHYILHGHKLRFWDLFQP